MGRFILKRLAFGVATLWVLSLVVFFATQALPGDTALAILGRQSADPARLAAVREQLGLNRPIIVQYLTWSGGLLTGDLGNSLANGQPLGQFLGGRVVNSLSLMVTSSILGIPLALVAGMLSAVRRDRTGDHVWSFVTLVLAAVPEFVLGVSLVILLSTGILHLLPAVSFVDPTRPLWSQLNVLILPTLTLALATMPYVSRMIRGLVIEILESDYVEMARLKGLSPLAVLLRHALPNATGPVVQVIALQLAWLAGGIVVVEYVFRYPGIGTALVDAVSTRDMPVIQALTLLIGGVYVIVNLIADYVTMLVTPRARTGLDEPLLTLNP